MGKIVQMAYYMKKYLILWTITSILFAIPIGLYTPFISRISREQYAALISILAIMTILPSMILLKSEEIRNVSKMYKEAALALFLSYVFSPILALLFSHGLSDTHIKTGFVIANLVPASAASLGYVMLASGNIELATLLIIVLIVLSFLVIPLYLSLYASLASIHLPLIVVLKSLVLVLLLPLVAGQLIRFLLLKKKNKEFIEKNLKPILSIVTMTSMLLLVFLLIARKSLIIVNKFITATEIMALQSIIMLLMIALVNSLCKIAKVKEKEKRSIAFISITKNQSIAAAIAVSNLSAKAALPSALIPTIQPVIAILYLNHLTRGKR